jgi:hypothetical protein
MHEKEVPWREDDAALDDLGSILVLIEADEENDEAHLECDLRGTPLSIVANTQKPLAMLRILHGTSTAALDAFHAADNAVDEQLVLDLEAMVTRTHAEIERLSALPDYS